ncbi:hypothetical protein [Myxosarcina sp. GI1(2024)]
MGTIAGGKDTFVVMEGFTDQEGSDSEYNIFKDFRSGEDIIGLAGGLTFDDLSFGVNSDTTIVSIADTSDVLAWVENTVEGGMTTLTADDFTLYSELYWICS